MVDLTEIRRRVANSMSRLSYIQQASIDQGLGVEIEAEEAWNDLNAVCRILDLDALNLVR